MNKRWAFNGLCKKDFTCTDGATTSELHPCQTRFYFLKKIETNHQKVWRLLFFSFINILDPLHKQSIWLVFIQSYLIHPSVSFSTVSRSFAWKAFSSVNVALFFFYSPRPAGESNSRRESCLLPLYRSETGCIRMRLDYAQYLFHTALSDERQE